MWPSRGSGSCFRCIRICRGRWIAERIEWQNSIRVLSGRVAELRPLYLPPDPAGRTVYLAGEIAQHDFWFPPVELPVGFGQTRTAKQLPVLTMITGYARHADGVLIPSRTAEDLFAGWWRLIARLPQWPSSSSSRHAARLASGPGWPAPPSARWRCPYPLHAPADPGDSKHRDRIGTSGAALPRRRCSIVTWSPRGSRARAGSPGVPARSSWREPGRAGWRRGRPCGCCGRRRWGYSSRLRGLRSQRRPVGRLAESRPAPWPRDSATRADRTCPRPSRAASDRNFRQVHPAPSRASMLRSA